MPNRPKGRLNRIRGAKTLPMPYRERIEGQQLVPIFLQTDRGLFAFFLLAQKERQKFLFPKKLAPIWPSAPNGLGMCIPPPMDHGSVLLKPCLAK